MDKITNFFEKHYKAIAVILLLAIVVYYFVRKKQKEIKIKQEEAAAEEALKKVLKDANGDTIDVSALANNIYNAIFETGTIYGWAKNKEAVTAAVLKCKAKAVYLVVAKAYAAIYLKADCYPFNISVHCYQTGSIEGDTQAIFGETEFLNTAINALQ